MRGRYRDSIPISSGILAGVDETYPKGVEIHGMLAEQLRKFSADMAKTPP
jgi:hypothetical protein